MELGSGGVAPPNERVATLVAAIDRFCESAPCDSADEQMSEMTQVRRGCDRLELRFSQTAAAFAATDAYEDQGSVSPIDWIRHHCHITSYSAGDRVAVGENLGRLPDSLEAMDEGDIGFAHLVTMARTADACPESRFDESDLLAKAKESSAGKFRYVCRHYRHSLEPIAYAEEQVDQVESRRLEVSQWEDGSYTINGVLDAAGGAAVRTALEPLARKSGDHDIRKHDRRMADALVEFVEKAQPVQLQVTTTLETLLGKAGAPAAEMEYSIPISSKTVERFACDSSVTRILMDSESMVIDVGRAKRVVSGAQRKALRARDRHCVWPGCERPASLTAAHHLIHWTHGGSTDLPNLTLLCGRHHWCVHEGNWQLIRETNGKVRVVPPMLAFGPRSRAPALR